MKEMKEFIKEKCPWVFEKENMFQLAAMVIYTLLFTKTCTQLVYGAESMYQTFRDFYFYRAVSFFLIFILIERKVNLLSKPILITLVTYVGIFWRHFVVNFYEAEYKADLRAQWIAWGLFLLVMVDILRTGKRAGFNRKNKIFCIIMSVAFMLALICDVQFSLSMVCPFLALYTTPISKKRWIKIMDCFTIGYYIAFVKIMTTSLINVPYKTNIQESVFKYYGIFLNTATGGMFAAGAFICVLYWLTKVILNKKRVAVGAVISLLAMIYPIFATTLFASRAAEIGILFAVLFSLIFVSGKSKDKFWLKRGGIVFVSGVAAILILIGGMYAVKDLDYSAIENISNEFIRTKVAYFRDVASRMMSMTSSYSYFEDGTILCAIDEATSYRLTTAIGGMQQVTLWGNGGMTLTVRDTFYMYPHNNYVSWMMMYGWVGGIPMVVWFIASLVTAAGAIVRKEQNCLLSFLWAAFLVMLMLTETVLWLYPAAFILLMVQYPLLVNQEETDIAETVECNEVFMGDNRMYIFIKKCTDRILAFLGLVILSPVLLLVILAIKLDSRGPVFFRQKRVGIHKKHFDILKFRTMRIDAPKDTPTHLLQNPEKYITRMGRFLRKTSLDELPQIINILKGDMAIIGPRPALWNQFDLIAERDKYGANDILPGLTGWAQINGRDELPVDVKAKLDGEYVAILRKNFFAGMVMDIKCFLGTIRSVITHDGVVEGGTGTLDETKDDEESKK